MSNRRKTSNEYKKERNPLIVVLYILAVILLVGCIGYFIYTSRERQSMYQETVYQASLTETEMLITEREEETESESETETETESETDTESSDEDESESDTDQASNATAEAETETYVNPYAPVLVLSSNKAAISVGDTFDPVSVVESITDDADNKYVLWRNIQVEGTYNSSIPGIYQMFIYVVDSSGYSSNREMILLEVKDTEEESETESDVED